ncbi:unnamed protein product, partial [Polarella glacialis]
MAMRRRWHGIVGRGEPGNISDEKQQGLKTTIEYFGNAETQYRAGDLQIFNLTLSQLSYRSCCLQREKQPHARIDVPGALLWSSLPGQDLLDSVARSSGLSPVLSQRAFVAPLTEDVTSASAQTRRSLLATVGIAGFGPAWAPQAFGAEAAAEAPKVKKERPPENLIVDGREGSNKNVNGRWTIVFGKKLNGKAVYKKDGETLYLLNNACDEFQIDTVASKTECTGLAVKKNGVW